MAESKAAKPYGIIGLIFAGAGVVILLLMLLDYWQDGKAESSLLLVGVPVILLGVFLYINGRKSQG